MSDPDNHTLRLLQKVRDDILGLSNRLETFERKVDKRFDAVDKRLDGLKQAAFGESVLGRYAAADVENRLLRLEEIMALRRS